MKQSIKCIYIISLFLVIIDQIVKTVISTKIHLYDSVTIIKNFLDINLVHNTGAAFSFLEGGRVIFIIIAILVVLFITYFINKEDINNNYIVIYGLLIGGIIGNLLDRIIYGYVIDYISFIFGSYRFPVFNFADICIVISVLIAVILTIKEEIWK